MEILAKGERADKCRCVALINAYIRMNGMETA
jgi:hypothetical protein